MKEKMEEVKNRIMPNDKAMILAYDQGFEHGPRDFLGHPECVNFEYILDIAHKGRFSGLVLHAGLAEKYAGEIADSGVPLILKLNGKSELFTEEDPFSPQLYSVEDAITLGATAVGYTVYSGSKYENEMLREFSKIVREAHSKGMMAIGWMYFR
jgi:class I fructose-bisphosphate aldolase